MKYEIQINYGTSRNLVGWHGFRGGYEQFPFQFNSRKDAKTVIRLCHLDVVKDGENGYPEHMGCKVVKRKGRG